MWHFIARELRPNVHKYRYTSVDNSLVSRYVLGPYWNWLVTLFPRWVAPNTITLMGLLLVVGNVLSLLYLDHDLENSTRVRAEAQLARPHGGSLPVVPLLHNAGLPPSLARPAWRHTASVIPPWLLFVWAVCLFFYQSFDSIDGKQARRTGMAGPLGEMFDHGCDALNTTFEVLLATSAIGLGRSYFSLMLLLSSTINFYLSTWEEYHTHTLFLSAFSGPVEGILITCVVYLMSGLLGGPEACNRGILTVTGLERSGWVRERAAWANWPLNDVVVTLATLGIVYNIVASYSNVIKTCLRDRRSVVRPLFGLLPLVVQIGANVAWMEGNAQFIYRHGAAFTAFQLYWGICFAYMVGLLITAHVCGGAFPHWNVTCVVSLLGALDAHLPTPLLQRTDAASAYVVYAALGFSLALYGYFVYDIITTITAESTSHAAHAKLTSSGEGMLHRLGQAGHRGQVVTPAPAPAHGTRRPRCAPAPRTPRSHSPRRARSRDPPCRSSARAAVAPR